MKQFFRQVLPLVVSVILLLAFFTKTAVSIEETTNDGTSPKADLKSPLRILRMSGKRMQSGKGKGKKNDVKKDPNFWRSSRSKFQLELVKEASEVDSMLLNNIFGQGAGMAPALYDTLLARQVVRNGGKTGGGAASLVTSFTPTDDPCDPTNDEVIGLDGEYTFLFCDVLKKIVTFFSKATDPEFASLVNGLSIRAVHGDILDNPDLLLAFFGPNGAGVVKDLNEVQFLLGLIQELPGGFDNMLLTTNIFAFSTPNFINVPNIGEVAVNCVTLNPTQSVGTPIPYQESLQSGVTSLFSIGDEFVEFAKDRFANDEKGLIEYLTLSSIVSMSFFGDSLIVKQEKCPNVTDTVSDATKGYDELLEDLVSAARDRVFTGYYLGHKAAEMPSTLTDHFLHGTKSSKGKGGKGGKKKALVDREELMCRLIDFLGVLDSSHCAIIFGFYTALSDGNEVKPKELYASLLENIELIAVADESVCPTPPKCIDALESN